MVFSSLTKVLILITFSYQAAAAAIVSRDTPTTNFQRDALDAHNKYRAKENIDLFEWDTDLANQATVVAKSCIWNPKNLLGHNLIADYNLDSNSSSISAATDIWYENHQNSVIHKGSAKVGCGVQHCLNFKTDYYVCIYSEFIPPDDFFVNAHP